MRKASLIFYTIGLVFAWIALIAGIALIVVGSITLVREGMEAGLYYLVPGIITTVIYLIVIAIISAGRRQVRAGKRNNKFFHIVALILGIVSFDIFYVLGAIFGLIARK